MADYENEHERWRLYEKALDHADPSVRKALEAAILQEEDENVALSVVLRVLERAPRSERTAWINRLSGSRSREYARARATDMATLEDLVRNVLPAGEGGLCSSVEDWSDWLQLRLAQKSFSADLLKCLATAGRTKRIRRSASERLTTLGASVRSA
ncbi:hypothetical protein [Microbispora bryophytorum]|uniref:HEAT repeat domain-containing protein n=1 Tax=Microbispora bryophytorum subsp. camponoti TaxID=1677852 RepID=A0ABR8L156_9ACTN|nr:hypothetical protein [Microbispora camponoti]MBD3144726.1 hypothetical protein [Microbispora camponoti]